MGSECGQRPADALARHLLGDRLLLRDLRVRLVLEYAGRDDPSLVLREHRQDLDPMVGLWVISPLGWQSDTQPPAHLRLGGASAPGVDDLVARDARQPGRGA